MDFAKFLELLFFPSNVLLVVFLILVSASFPAMSYIDLFVYGLAIFGFPITFYVMNKKSRKKYRTALISISFTILFFTLFSFLFASLRNLKSLYLATYSFLFLGLFVFFMRLKWKVSLHVSMLTASVTVLSTLYSNLYPLYLLVPLVAWSRIKLRVHTFYQVLAGFVIGFLIPSVFFL